MAKEIKTHKIIGRVAAGLAGRTLGATVLTAVSATALAIGGKTMYDSLGDFPQYFSQHSSEIGTCFKQGLQYLGAPLFLASSYLFVYKGGKGIIGRAKENEQEHLRKLKLALEDEIETETAKLRQKQRRMAS